MTLCCERRVKEGKESRDTAAQMRKVAGRITNFWVWSYRTSFAMVTATATEVVTAAETSIISTTMMVTVVTTILSIMASWKEKVAAEKAAAEKGGKDYTRQYRRCRRCLVVVLSLSGWWSTASSSDLCYVQDRRFLFHRYLWYSSWKRAKIVDLIHHWSPFWRRGGRFSSPLPQIKMMKTGRN